MTEAAAWGLACPTLTDARDAVHRVHADDGPGVWNQLLREAGLRGTETDPDDLERVLGVMTNADPVTRLCALAMRIRLATYTYLSAAHTMTTSTKG
jgi:hypothetical protein